MSTRTGRVGSALLLCLLGAFALANRDGGVSRAAADEPQARHSLADLAWIAGDWRSEFGDNVLQEHWDGPIGDSMMGMFRWVRGGKLWITEHVTVVDDGERIAYRFRHFSRELSAWEDKDDPITFELLSVTDGHAVFENPNPPRNRPKRILYTRDGDTLTVRIEGEHSDKPDVFTFKLAP